MEKTYTITLKENELKLLDYFLEELEYNQSNACCNDLPKQLVELFTKEQGQVIATEYANYNNPEEPEGPSWPIPDFCLLGWLKRKIKNQYR